MDSCQCMAKPIQYCKVKKVKIKIKKKKKNSNSTHEAKMWKICNEEYKWGFAIFSQQWKKVELWGLIIHTVTGNYSGIQLLTKSHFCFHNLKKKKKG